MLVILPLALVSLLEEAYGESDPTYVQDYVMMAAMSHTEQPRLTQSSHVSHETLPLMYAWYVSFVAALVK